MSSAMVQLELRKEQLKAATETGADNLDAFKRNIEALENVLGDLQFEIQQAEESRIWIIAIGIGMLLSVKLLQGIVANTLLERRYIAWLSDRSVPSGMIS